MTETTATDEQLVREYLGGNEAAFSVLVDRYMKHLYNFVRQFVHDPAVAEDIVQETFVKAWRHLRRFDSTQSFKTWIFAIAKNTTYDVLRKKKSLPFSALTDESGGDVLERIADSSPRIDEILDREVTARDLADKLATLPPLYRSLLVLHYQEHFSLHEIAATFGEPYNTIKSRHNRALQSLRRAFT